MAPSISDDVSLALFNSYSSPDFQKQLRNLDYWAHNRLDDSGHPFVSVADQLLDLSHLLREAGNDPSYVGSVAGNNNLKENYRDLAQKLELASNLRFNLAPGENSRRASLYTAVLAAMHYLAADDSANAKHILSRVLPGNYEDFLMSDQKKNIPLEEELSSLLGTPYSADTVISGGRVLLFPKNFDADYFALRARLYNLAEHSGSPIAKLFRAVDASGNPDIKVQDFFMGLLNESVSHLSYFLQRSKSPN